MRNISKIIWGSVLVLVAVLLGLDSLGVITFDLFFDGWWTLFIIIPSLTGIIRDKDKSGAAIGLCIGVILLLAAQEVISWDMMWKIALPLIIAIIGLKMIFSSLFKKSKAEKIIKEIKIEGRNSQSGVAVFCGTDMNFDNAVFEGADLVAVFGGIDCDLRHAIIERDCVIKTACVFGGIDIKIPKNVRVVSNVSCIFGGTEVKNENLDGMHTIYIDGACVFGGVEVK